MKRNSFSALADFHRRQRAVPHSVSMRCAAVFSLADFYHENRSLLLLAVLGVIVAGGIIWLIFRRRGAAFPQITFEADRRVPEKDGDAMMDAKPEKAPRSGPFPGIFGKIEVLVNDRQINTYLVTENPLPIGRDPAQALVVIQEAIVSKLHCSIFYRAGQVFIKDLNSTNGTYLNGEKISERELHDNDAVSLGRKGTIKIIYHK